ncbi:Ataxin-10 [Coemansia sp. RSA 552]|nr:Ataxin-10 [Coemansia sp. RSA 552]
MNPEANGVSGDIVTTGQIMIQREMTYPEAAQCGTLAGQTLSNMITNNKAMQRTLLMRELLDLSLPYESIYWYLLVSTRSKTTMAGLVLILNSLKDDPELTRQFCTCKAGRVVAGKIGEMFGESNDDEAQEKTLLYVILSGIIESGCLELLLTGDPEFEMYGFLGALAVYCNENTDPVAYERVFSEALLDSLCTVLHKCRDFLAGVWQNDGDDTDMDAIIAAHRSLASAVSVLGTVTTDMTTRLASRVRQSSLIRQAVALLGLLSKELPRIEKASAGEALAQPASRDESIRRLFMFKRDLIMVMGNVAYGDRATQDLVRELDGLALVLDHMRIDENQPFIKEYAVVALRSLTEGNTANQEYVQGMTALEAVQNPELARAGIRTTIGADGRPSFQKIDRDSPGGS